MSEARETRLVGAPQCSNCKFSTLVTVTRGNMKTMDRRECRRYPPEVTAFMVGRKDNGEPIFMSHSSWPLVLDTNDCGEHRPRLAGLN